jgi:peptidoglycan/xylan/chitin deacetylase (PgdA/CDA1 family)
VTSLHSEGFEPGVSKGFTSSAINLARGLGVLSFARRIYKSQNSILILCYHGVSQADEDRWRPALYISAESFRRRLETIKKFGYSVLPLPHALRLMRAGELLGPTVAITFDDGWHDFYRVAWPLLQEFEFPSTVYQTTFYTLYNRPVFDTACSYLLWKSRGKSIRCKSLIGIDLDLKLDSNKAIDTASSFFRTRVRELEYSAEQKDTLLCRVAEALQQDYEAFLESRILQLMNPCEVAEVSRTNVDIQLHTHRHQTPFDRTQFHREIYDNREHIESITGKPAVHFCYPNGDHRPEFGRWLREAGVQSATTTDPGVASPACEPLFLPRITDSACVSQARFESWLSGIGLIGPACRKAWARQTWFGRSVSEQQLKDPGAGCRSEWAG